MNKTKQQHNKNVWILDFCLHLLKKKFINVYQNKTTKFG